MDNLPIDAYLVYLSGSVSSGENDGIGGVQASYGRESPGTGATDPINAYYVYQSGYVYSGDGYNASHVYNSYGHLTR